MAKKELVETPQLRELRACQAKIRLQKHELRCITEAHQRTLFAIADVKKQNVSLYAQIRSLREAYDKMLGKGPNWLRLSIRDLAMVLFRMAQ